MYYVVCTLSNWLGKQTCAEEEDMYINATHNNGGDKYLFRVYSETNRLFAETNKSALKCTGNTLHYQ